MSKVTILHASVNPSYYDVKALTKMNFDEAKDFFEKDTLQACSCAYTELSSPIEAEKFFFPEGANFGDTSDCLLVWVKVSLS